MWMAIAGLQDRGVEMIFISLGLVVFWAIQLGMALKDHHGLMIFLSLASLVLTGLLHAVSIEGAIMRGRT